MRFVLLVLILTFFTSVCKADYLKATMYLTEGNETKAFEEFLVSAKAGDTSSQYNVGYMYEEGKGVERNYKKAHYWYKKAAAKKHMKAIHNLGNLYYFGKGVERKLDTAEMLFKYNSEKGDAESMFNLALIYFEDEKKEYEKAYQWFQKSYENGIPKALLFIGICLEDGLGIEANLEKAIETYKKASREGVHEAETNLGLLYMQGRTGISQNCTEALKWATKAADAGESKSMFNLGLIYQNGCGSVKKDKNKAKEFYTKAADKGLTQAKIKLLQL